MPLPERKPNETHDEFRDRCMKDPVMVKEFPDADRRRAVCERQAKLKGDGYLNLVSEPGALIIEAAGEDEQTTNGKPKLPRFSMAAYTGGPMRIAGWRYPVIVDLAGLSIPSQSRPIRFGHDMASGVGHTDAIKIEDGKLLATGLVSRDTAAAKEVVASARNGFPWQASITAAIEEFEFVKENQRVTVNGREYSGPVNVVRKATLGEISFVDLGADGQSFAHVAATAPHFQEEKMQMDENVSTNTQTAEKETPEVNQAAGSATATENKPAGTVEAQNTGPTAGNAGGAMAAYAARAGMEAFVFMPADTPAINQFEARLFGAKVFLVDGLITDCSKIVRAGMEPMGWFDMSTLKEPYRIEGKKTMGLELAEQFDWKLPDVILYPTGGGTGLIGMWKAFEELAELGWLESVTMPRMVAVQSDGCCPIVRAFERGERFAEPFQDARTIASGIRVPAAVGDFMILDAVRQSGGCAVAVDERQIVHWMQTAAFSEGISVCPESAACVGAAQSLADTGWIGRDDRVVLFNCGAAQKYPHVAAAQPPQIENASNPDWDWIARGGDTT